MTSKTASDKPAPAKGRGPKRRRPAGGPGKSGAEGDARGDLNSLGARLGRIARQFLERQAESGRARVPDPNSIIRAFAEVGAKILADPVKVSQLQAALLEGYAGLWRVAARRLMGEAAEPVIAPEPGDRRFKDNDWSEKLVFDVIKQSYLLSARRLRGALDGVEGVDAHTRAKVDFFARQIVNGLAPSNFPLTNPVVLRETVRTRGANLVRGLDNLLTDLERGRGSLRITMTDPEAFHLGEDVAVTPGAVVYQNELLQLIQYAPSTAKVAARPLLIVPPWINKFYVLDLQPENSLIKWLVAQGQTVFVISWINPDQRLSHKRFDDYLLEGPLAAMDAIAEITGQAKINVTGYCIGGTLLACLLSYLAAKGEDRVASATFLTSMTDFSEAGELSVFIDDEQLAGLDASMAKKGYLEGAQMASVFSMMRDNDLIWSFVVNNYLMGRQPVPFDLLYWNADSTRMPAMMHGFYLRKMYLENKLIEPGGLTVAGVPIDLGRINVPVYMLATAEDHIAPWKSTYSLTGRVAGPVRFVLSASGHIAGVINPPAKRKYNYWVGAENPPDADAWLAAASSHPGSWWPDWGKWLGRHAGRRTLPARQPGDGPMRVIEPAPGSYVRMRSGG